jgi:hypothetical protein
LSIVNFRAAYVIYASPSRLSVNMPNVSGYLSVRSSAIPKEYVQRLEIAYGDDDDDKPHDCIREINGLDPKIDFNGGTK